MTRLEALQHLKAEAPARGISNRLWWLAIAVAWAVLYTPLLLVDVPPLGDYPNHLARMHVLATMDHDPVLGSMVARNWAVIPDLAVDSFMPLVVAVVPVLVAGRLLLAMIFLLHLLGGTACATVLHGRRTWWSLAVVFTVYHFALMMGFLNFDLTLAAALLLAAGWMTLRARGRAVAAGAVAAGAAAVLFFGHLMGLCFFLLLIGSFEASLLWQRVLARTGIMRALLDTWPSVAALLPILALYPLTGFAHENTEAAWPDAGYLLKELLAPFTTYNWTLDVVTAAALAAFLVGCALMRRLRVARGSILALIVLLLCYALLPDQFKGTGYIDVRVATMLGIVAVIGVRPILGHRATVLAGAAFAVLFAVRIAVIAWAWSGYQTDVVNMRALIAHIQPGDRVNQMDIGLDDVPTFYDDAPTAWRLSDSTWTYNHLLALALIERDAFWPLLFTNPGQQPIRFKPRWQALAFSGLDLPSYADLRYRRARGNPAGGLPPGENPFCAFDWILLQGAWAEPHPETLSPDWLQLVQVNRTAALYHVRGDRTCAITPKPTLLRAPQG